MLDLNRFVDLAARFRIRSRDSGKIVPLRFNPSQNRITKACMDHREKGLPLWIIFLKARRLGVSTWAMALLTAQCLARSNASAYTVAQLASTATELFAQAEGFAKSLPYVIPDPTQQIITFPHKDGNSTLKKATAKTVIGGRGMTVSDLHMTEAAFYPGVESFVALLNTVSRNDPENIVIIETTANGMEGQGKTYYDYWQGAVSGDNGFLPIFLPWYEDPGCCLPDELAEDAPADDYERTLMKEFKLSKGRIAWYRWCLETLCAGSIHKWRQEYPSTPEEAFVSTGNPAFDHEEMSLANHAKRQPIAEGDIELIGGHPETRVGATPVFRESRGGPLKIYEFPEPGCHYFNGVDAAKGVDTGDFAAMIGINGCTGDMAFRFDQRIGPELMGEKALALGMFYNKAMINVELTGGWGYVIFKDLRDKYHYPNMYLRKMKDDAADMSKARSMAGWETTKASRRMLFDLFRTALRRGEIGVKDATFISQMSRAILETGGRWTIRRGHDDVFMAGLLAWVAVEHYHVKHTYDRVRRSHTVPGSDASDLDPENQPGSMPNFMVDGTSVALGMLSQTGNAHIEALDRYNKARKQFNRLEGI